MPHVFFSYVREDQCLVDRLASVLKRAGVQVWLDREQIKPGQRWQSAIAKAIEEGAFFIACFSKAQGERSKSYMNEELTLAIDELRQRPTDRAWFIPILLNSCVVPDRSIGAGETLRDIQWVDLHDDWDKGLQQLLGVIGPPHIIAELTGSRHHVVQPVYDYPVELTIGYKIKKTTSERHDYQLEVTLKNIGVKHITQWHIDVELPTQLLYQNINYELVVPNRSDQERTLFRVTQDHQRDPIYPGDTKIMINIDYRVDQNIFWGNYNLFDQTVTAIAYIHGELAATAEEVVKDLQVF